MSDSDQVKVDAIVVGAGPAGLSAAWTMASQGLDVIVIERGATAGSKNVGGLLYGTVLSRMLPGFHEQAPIERTVRSRSLVFLSNGQHASLNFGSEEWSRPPFNHTFIVFRSQFDRWFAAETEKVGATLLEGTVVEELLYDGTGDDRKAVGVRVRGDELFHADVLVLADGANALVSEQAGRELGFRSGRKPQEWAIGVKEIIGLPREKIEDRFHLEENEGTAIDFFGSPFEGLIGGGFLYTAREALHLGFAVRAETLVRSKLSPHEIMDGFRNHPLVRKYIDGGELLEYSAHLIPEGGYDAVPQLAGNGVLIAGDAAGLVNMSLYKEGTNHAMESGSCAGETALDACRRGDFSRAALADYEHRLHRGIAMRDLEKSRRIPEILRESPELLSAYPRKVTRLLVDFFTMGLESKYETQRRATRDFLKGLPKLRFVRDLIRARKLV